MSENLQNENSNKDDQQNGSKETGRAQDYCCAQAGRWQGEGLSSKKRTGTKTSREAACPSGEVARCASSGNESACKIGPCAAPRSGDPFAEQPEEAKAVV